MSRKRVVGITLTPQERQMAGYDKPSGQRQTSVPAPLPSPPGDDLRFHACQVTLPEGTACQAHYTRYGSGTHAFAFLSPLETRVYWQGKIGDTEAIEARAQELVGKAWRQAQAAEQKVMRLPAPPPHLLHSLDPMPTLRRATARRFAGLYAVCLRYPSATLTPLSPACERPADALRDLRHMQQAGDSRVLVVGVCCRWARRWQEPRFLADLEDEAGAACRTDWDAEAAEDDVPDPDEDSEAIEA